VIRGGGWLKGGNGVDRDGGWRDFAGSCRSANRNRLQPGYRIVNLGFRVARVPADK
jgi:formylglycine-generating enzyme required for sulfatase activity